METPQVSFKQVVSCGCGFDVHKKMVVATIDGKELKKQTREFGPVTSSLKELRDWLLENKITHVARESMDQRIKEALSPYENALEMLKKVPGISSKSVSLSYLE
jgi:hypothetical protein